MKFSLNNILKGTVKFILPPDCPDELINYHVDALKDNIRISILKIKSIFKKQK